MDKEKNNELELNTPENNAEKEGTPMTADELIQRLKSNLKQNPGLKGEDIFAEETAENTEKEVDSETVADDIPEENVLSDSSEDEAALEDVAEEVEPPVRKRNTPITDSIKKLIASLKNEDNGETPEEAVAEEVQPEVKAEETEEVQPEVKAEETEEVQPEVEAEEVQPAIEKEAVAETAENAFDMAVEETENAVETKDEEKNVVSDVEDNSNDDLLKEIFGRIASATADEAVVETEGKAEDVNAAEESVSAEIKAVPAVETAEEIIPEVAEQGEVKNEEEAAPVAEKEYSVLIENSSDKTNIFDPGMIKKGRKTKNTQNLFKDNEAPAVAEAEQLTFSMTEDDIQKSIEEAEAFIFERQHVEDPSEVINSEETVSSDNLLAENTEKTEEYDETDLWIASAFGDEDELKKKFGEEEAQKIETQLDIDVKEYLKSEKKEVRNAKIAEEYTSPSQKKEIFASYRKAHKIGLMKIAGCFLVMLLAFIYENLSTFGGNLPGALNQNNYPVVYILGSLQILVIAGAIAWSEINRGIKAIWAMRPIPESITAVVAISSAVYHIAHCFISETDPKVALYMFPAVICIFVTLIYDYFNLRREIYSFNIVASKRIKYTITPVETEKRDLENEAFSEYLAEEDEISMFKIGKTGFVKGFSERMNTYSKNNSIITILLSLAIALGLVFFIVSTVVYDAKTAFSFGYLAFLVAIPCCALLSFSLPFYRASKKAFEDDSAIIGEISLDEYSRANTLSFDDKDVFPSYGVKVKSIKVYGDSRIDKILYNSASVFKVIGGPLSDVFDTATHELGKSDNMEIIEIAKDGIEALIDGSHVYIGKASYLKAHNYLPVTDTDDDILETSGDASIMYMVCDDVVSAKMYIQYTIDPDFEFALRRLYKAGICIGIKTFDPNIDDKLLGSKVKITKYPVRILRCKTLEEAAAPQDEANSGIVSKGSPRSLLNAFVLCSKVLFANRTNITAKILSVAFSVVLMSFFLMFSSVTAIPSIYVALYQVFWMVPVYLISKFYV